MVVVVGGHFDPNDVEDASNPYPRPLFLLPLPPLLDADGGDCGGCSRGVIYRPASLSQHASQAEFEKT